MVSASVFQTDDAGSIPVHRSIRFHARWEFPAGSHDHAGRVRWSTSPFVRRTREYRQRPSSYGWMMRTALCRKGWCESDKAYPPSAGKVSWNAGDRVSCQPTHRLWERSRWSMGVTARDPCHASCCSMRVHRRHGCRIRHEWSNPQWTARAYPCGLPAHAFVAQPVEATVQGTVRSGFESRRKHQRKQWRQHHPIRFERLPERERCHGRFSS